MEPETVIESDSVSEIQKAYNKKIQYGYDVAIRWLYISCIPCVFISIGLYSVWSFVVILLPVIPIILAVVDGFRLRKKTKQDQDLVATTHVNPAIIIHDAKSSSFSKYNLAIIWIIAIVISVGGTIGMYAGISFYLMFKNVAGYKDIFDIFDILFLIFVGLLPLFLAISATVEKMRRKKLLDSQGSSTGAE